MTLSTVETAVAAIRRGDQVIVVDDENRENEGDLIMAAAGANPERVAFMIRYTSGIICAPCEPERLERLQIPMMAGNNSDPLRTAFTVSVDYHPGMTTGVSALERARTLAALADDDVGGESFVRPGHVFPLKYRPGGVLVRSGHTEAAVDLCKLAGLQPVGALAELNHDDGSMMRLPALLEFAEVHGLPIISIESLIRHRAEHDALIREVSSQPVSIANNIFTAHIYQTLFDGREITAIVKGEIDAERPTLVRVVKGIPGKDFFSSAIGPDNVINRSLNLIAEAEQGVFIYLAPGSETPTADEQAGSVWREVGLGSQILNMLGVRRIHLLASKELTYPGISSFGLSIESVIKEI
ncbi:MAG: 3,4-dihydroxy-2-butanone-4-phosphate synthase [Pseudomonadales bacterium]